MQLGRKTMSDALRRPTTQYGNTSNDLCVHTCYSKAELKWCAEYDTSAESHPICVSPPGPPHTCSDLKSLCVKVGCSWGRRACNSRARSRSASIADPTSGSSAGI